MAEFQHTSEWLSISEVARRLGASRSLVRAHIRSGCLRAINIGTGQERREWRINAADFDRFVSSRRTPSTGEEGRP